MANHPFATASAGATSTSRASCAAPSTGKLTCLCSPTNHPGSFRCSRHRSSRGRPASSSSSRASQQAASTSGASASVTGRGEEILRSGGVGAGVRTTKGRSVLRAHLLRLVSPPSSGGHDHRRCRDFKPRPSRLGRLAVTAWRQPVERCSASQLVLGSSELTSGGRCASISHAPSLWVRLAEQIST